MRNNKVDITGYIMDIIMLDLRVIKLYPGRNVTSEVVKEIPG